MGWRSKSKVRRNAQKKGYRSGFELKVSEKLNEAKVSFGYEDTVIPYIKPATTHKYTIDFRLPNGILIEAKGRWTLEDRKKHLLVRKQHPELDIRIVFQSPNNKIRKGSKTTYADFCDKHGIQWAAKEVPESWYKT
jgi:hypothetical protein